MHACVHKTIYVDLPLFSFLTEPVITVHSVQLFCHPLNLSETKVWSARPTFICGLAKCGLPHRCNRAVHHIMIWCDTSRTRYQRCCDRSLSKKEPKNIWFLKNLIPLRSASQVTAVYLQLPHESNHPAHFKDPSYSVRNNWPRRILIRIGSRCDDAFVSEESLSLMISAALLHLSRRARRTHGHRRCMQKRICLVQSCVAGEGHRCQCRQWWKSKEEERLDFFLLGVEWRNWILGGDVSWSTHSRPNLSILFQKRKPKKSDQFYSKHVCQTWSWLV